MARIVLPYQLDLSPRNAPDPSGRQRAGWLLSCFYSGLGRSIQPLGLLTAIIGGSVLAYVGYTASLSLPLIVGVVAVAVLSVALVGAESAFWEAYRAAWAYAPTWQMIQRRADTLRALAEGSRDFRGSYVPNHMIATRSDYDRAVEAGFAPDFPRERIPSLQYEEVESLIAALDEVVHRWQIAERENGARGPS